MTRITFLYWQCLSNSEDRDPIRITVAECPRCGHRSTANGFGIDALRACGEKMRAECPRGEENTYSHEVFPALEESHPGSAETTQGAAATSALEKPDHGRRKAVVACCSAYGRDEAVTGKPPRLRPPRLRLPET